MRSSPPLLPPLLPRSDDLNRASACSRHQENLNNLSQRDEQA